MTFHLTLKKSLNFAMTGSYFLLSAAVILVEVRTSSASSPRQYSSVLTCCSSTSAVSPETLLNCSNRLYHLGQSSGLLKLKASGGCKRTLTISLKRQEVLKNQTIKMIHHFVYLTATEYILSLCKGLPTKLMPAITV